MNKTKLETMKDHLHDLLELAKESHAKTGQTVEFLRRLDALSLPEVINILLEAQALEKVLSLKETVCSAELAQTLNTINELANLHGPEDPASP